MIKAALFLLLFLEMILQPVNAWSAAIAVLPFEDLTQGANSVDLETTALVSEELLSYGFDVVPGDSVREFMVNNRIRWTGFIDLYYASNMGEALGADGILIGTITYRHETPRPAMALSLILTETKRGRIIWGGNFSMAAGENISVLDMGAITTVSQLSPILFSRLVLDFPEFGPAPGVKIPVYAVQSYDLSSRFVEGGAPMECKVGFRFFDEVPDDVLLKLSGGRISYISMAREGGSYVARWFAPQEEGRYAISTIVRWRGSREDVKFLASYRVVNEKPSMSMTFGNGIPVGPEGIIAFRSFLNIGTKFSRVAPIVRYRFVVENIDGKKVLDYRNEESLPEVLIWRGAGDTGPLGNGYYRITLSVTDAIGNVISDTAKVYIKATPPRIGAAMDPGIEGQAVLRLFQEQDTLVGGIDPVPIKYWQVRLMDREQNVFLEEFGEELPTEFKFDPGATNMFVCSFEARDALGNRLEQKGLPLRLVRAEEEKKEKDTSGWTDGF